LKAATEAKSREGRAIRATTIFFWFFSCEKEKNEKNIDCHFFRKSSAKIGLSRNAHPSRLFASGMAFKERSMPTLDLIECASTCRS
jgi:hypothetical protein